MYTFLVGFQLQYIVVIDSLYLMYTSFPHRQKKLKKNYIDFFHANFKSQNELYFD